jgi:quinohemoprotein ethanol dehydrogenase
MTSKITPRIYPGIIYTFGIGGNAAPPEYPELPPNVLIEGQIIAELHDLDLGGQLYTQHCNRCHGTVGNGGGALPDLAFSSKRIHENFKYIVEGSFETLGMPSFKGKLTDSEINLIQQHIFAEAEN